jgi:hypothetical protein
MKTIKKIIEKIEKYGISVYPYTEEGILCGYELNTYTDGGVNEIVFLDFRDKNMNAENVDDFIKEFKSYISDTDIEERIELNRQDKLYRDNFSLKASLKDFKNWNKKMLKLIKKLEK